MKHKFSLRAIYILIISFTLIFSLQISIGQTSEENKRETIGSQEKGNYAEGNEWMVSTAHPLATDAANEMLKQGGNAIDAAIAAAFAIGVVEPDGSGLGGGGGMVIYLSKEKKFVFINYYQQASEEVNNLNFDLESDRKNARSILVPGTVEGLTTALEKYGTLPLSTVLMPAIRYAEEGFPVDRTLASLMLDNVELLQKYESTSAVYLSEGFPLMEGEILVQKDLAATLRKIVLEGKGGFYKGELARKMVDEINAAGGKITLGDLLNYKAEISEPLIGTYRGYQIVTAGFPQSGASIIQALNMLENKNLSEVGHFSQNGETLHLIAETLRRVYADRSAYIGDPDFEYIPAKGLLSKKYALVRFSDIDENYSSPNEYRKTKEGNPNPYDNESGDEEVVRENQEEKDFFDDNSDDEENSAPKRWNDQLFDTWGKVKKEKKKETNSEQDKSPKKEKNIEELEKEYDGGHTTHLCVVDNEGNMVSLTQTLGTFFGSGFISCGVLFNSSMSNFSQNMEINMPKPGKQPRSSISPTIVMKDNKPFLVVGSPGASRIISTVVQLLVNIIDFNMNVEVANNAPRIFCQKFDDYLHLEGRIPQMVQDAITKKGHNIRVYGDYDLFFGGAQMILIDWDKHKFFGSADLRRGGNALGK